MKSESKVDVPKLMGNVKPNFFLCILFLFYTLNYKKRSKTVKICCVVFWKRSLFHFYTTASHTTCSTEREFSQNGQYLNDSWATSKLKKKIVFSPWFRSSIRSYRNESQVRVESLQGKIFTKGFVYRSTCKVVSQRQKCYACLTRNLNCGNGTRCMKHFCIRIKPRRNFLCCLREMLGNLSNDDSDFNVYGKISK